MSALKSRGKSWASQEDEALCRAWLDVPQDVAVGVSQRADNLYARIHVKFLEICVENNVISIPERAPNGLKSRWHHINKNVSKFAGYLSEINDRNQSGASPEDIFNQALVQYAASEKSPFTLVNCYRILENAQKWKQYYIGKASKRSQCINDLETDDVREEIAAGETSSACGHVPKARDAAKKQKITEQDLAESGRLLAATAQAKLADSIQRTKVLSRLVNHSIMSVNLDGLSDVAKEYYALEQQRILSEMRRAEPIVREDVFEDIIVEEEDIN